MPLTGGEPRVLASLPNVYGLAVEGDHAYAANQPNIFCSSGPEGSLWRLSLTDGQLVQLVDPLHCPSMVTIHDDYLYWINNGSTVSEGPFAVPVDADGMPSGLEPGMSLGGGSLMRIQR